VRVCGRLDCSGLLLEITVDCLDYCGRGFCWILWIVLLLLCSPFATKILILFLCCSALQKEERTSKSVMDFNSEKRSGFVGSDMG